MNDASFVWGKPREIFSRRGASCGGKRRFQGGERFELELCEQYGVTLVEDAAESLGSTYKGRQTATTAPFSILSFNGNKIITTTGGGMLVAQRRDWVEKARFWSTQARDSCVAYHHTDMGYNYRLSNVLAGIGRGQLEVLDERIRQRRAVAFRYREAFGDLPGIALMPQAPYGLHTNWLSCFLRPCRFT